MPSLTEQLQTNIRAITGTAGQYNEDWHALCDLAGIARGQINERILAYYNRFNTGPATASSALNYFRLNPSTVTGGTINALFSAGEQGGWWDPSDFSTMFQDSAGTTPVTAAGQPVGKILDKSGRGNHRTQSTAASRPTLQQDVSGYYYLSYDGVDDFMVTGSIDLSVTNKLSFWAGMSAATGGMMFEFSPILDSNNGTFQLFGTGTGWQIQSKGTAATSVTPSVVAVVNNVVSAIADIAAPSLSARVNAGTYSTSAGSQGTGNYGNYVLYFGRRGGTTLPLGGREYGSIILGRAATATEITTAERYIGSKMGVAL